MVDNYPKESWYKFTEYNQYVDEVYDYVGKYTINSEEQQIKWDDLLNRLNKHIISLGKYHYDSVWTLDWNISSDEIKTLDKYQHNKMQESPFQYQDFIKSFDDLVCYLDCQKCSKFQDKMWLNSLDGDSLSIICPHIGGVN